MSLKRAIVVGLALILMATAAVSAKAEGVVPFDHWLYAAFAELSQEGLLPGYPQGMVGQDRELTRFEMAFCLKGMLERLEDFISGKGPAPCTPRQMALLEQCMKELRRELIALGASVRRLDEVNALWVRGTETHSLDPHEYIGLSQAWGGSSTEAPPETPSKTKSLGFVLPASYGISDSFQMQRSFIVSDTPFLPMEIKATVPDWLTEEQEWTFQASRSMEQGIFLMEEPLSADSTATTDVALNFPGSRSGVIWASSLSLVEQPTPWKLSAGPAFSTAQSPAGMILFGVPATARSASLDDSASKEPVPPSGSLGAYSSSALYTGVKGLDMQLEIGRFLIDTQSWQLPGFGNPGNLYGLLGVHARYDYASLGSLAAAGGSQTATLSLESRFVLGEYATLYGSYGYTAVRYSVAEQFSLSHSLTNAGVSVQLAPNLKLFAEYVVLSPTLPSQESQALLGLSYSDYGSLLFGYRLLHLGESEVLASFSLRF